MLDAKWLRVLLSTAALVALSRAVFAQESEQPLPPHKVTPNVTFVSEYVFRGLRQTWGLPAVQMGVDYTSSDGWYAGAWGSNTSGNLYASGGAEIDFYGGFAGKVSSDWSYNIGLLQYYYPRANYNQFEPSPGPNQRYDTTELYGSVSYRVLSLKYSHTLTNYFGYTGETAPAGAFAGDPAAGVALGRNSRGSGFLEANASFGVGAGISLSLHAGRQHVASSVGLDYTEWKVGLSRAFRGWTAGVAYTDTAGARAYDNTVSARGNGSSNTLGRATAVFSFGRTF